MNPPTSKPAPGLTLVAVPIGAARDITLHAIDVLRGADVLAAEDTRSLRHLMEIHGIPLGDRPLISYHDHNGDRARPRLLQAMAEGQSVAYASEAGTPLIADPGYDLALAAREAGYEVTTAPGVSAVITALSLAGLPTDRFLFAGFLPNQSKARKDALRELAGLQATLVFYESPKRIDKFLRDAVGELGGERKAAICRELTKKFEEIRKGTLAELLDGLGDATTKGEIVVVIDRAGEKDVSEKFVNDALQEELRAGQSLRDAAQSVAEATGWPRRKVYQLGLALQRD
ncbi:16S rRNA (cytidine(1402)-2'-O)-methyltransferase [Pseudooceanicola atlanticus]|uniref:Ribosomal RNA small subunit methyltransferase I n=1 Tax=Pseudooceanicola atlanticus TaxID=1461694 RepID=A0A0A0ECM0_9RHOB|nr:16S rRNA (cytidine(1402)-2'-O)-methyltransferase [Pseudooceanicola atlanticus]KGM48184.1 16S rRNA methyltransferase [Pseudooceanicola atlanticus]